MSATARVAGGAMPPVELTCPVCGSGLVRNAEGVRCVSCARQFTWMDGFLDLIVGERFPDASDDALLRYEEQSNRDLATNYWLPLFRSLPVRASGPLRVLSVGCGTGVDVEVLGDAGFDSIGIDCGNRVAVWPRRRCPERLLLANGKSLPFPDDTFDVVFCGCVFPHVGVEGDTNRMATDGQAQRQRLAREMARVVRPGGRIVVASPNRWVPFDIFHGRTPGNYRPRFNAPTSRYLLSFGDYRRLFREARCGPVAALPVEGYWGFIRSRNTLKGWLLGLPVRFVFWVVSRRPFAFLRATPVNPWLVIMTAKKG
jgi:SAM-dependent methyltransferase